MDVYVCAAKIKSLNIYSVRILCSCGSGIIEGNADILPSLPVFDLL